MDHEPRVRRLANEWKLLEDLAHFNTPLLEILGRGSAADGDVFRIVLRNTCGMIPVNDRRVVTSTHRVEIRFPRFFPSLPIEANLVVPVFHPNIEPNTGFACLWDRFYTGDTIVETILQLQQIISWKVVNFGVDHLMQPDAVAWHNDPQRSTALPLDFSPIQEPEEYALRKNSAAHFRGAGGLRRSRIVDT